MIRQTVFVIDMVLSVASAVSHIQSHAQNQAAEVRPEQAQQPTQQAQETPQLDEAASFENQRPTGVAVSKNGRLFVNFPFWSDEHSVSVAEVMRDGSMKPYPNQQWNSWREGSTGSPSKAFVCVQSVWVDDQDNLWILDPASPKMKGVLPDGPKLVKVRLADNQISRIFPFNEEIAPRGSYLNDVRVDTKRNFAYITDSGLGAIVVVNLESGQARRLLEDHSSTKAEPNVTLTVQGKQLQDETGKTPQIHADGIALSKDGDLIYYHALTGKTLYRVPTEALRQDLQSHSDQSVAQAVEKVGETVATDGMLIDEAGNVYHTALEQNAIVRFTPTKQLETVVQNERISWPDSMAFHEANGQTHLYFTTSQLQHMPKLGGNEADRNDPFHVFKIALTKAGGKSPTH